MRANGRRLSLNGLFWRYLLTAGALAVCIVLAWVFLFQVLLNMEVILPANYARRMATEVSRALEEADEFDEALIPHYYRWAHLSADGAMLDGNLDGQHLAAYLSGDDGPHGWYGYEYVEAALRDGTACVLALNYSVPYARASWQERLPDFQTAYLAALVAVLATALALCTRRHTRILKRDAAAIAAASDAIAAQRLDLPLEQRARVRELDAALRTMDELRASLAQSLREQWAQEQHRGEEIAALAHDLKTPLTVIGGNAELLAEDDLSDGQRASVEAILRSGRSAQEYVGRLRQMAVREWTRPEKQRVRLAEFIERCREAGDGLCAPKHIVFSLEGGATSSGAPGEAGIPRTIRINEADLLRAVINLLDNAVRFTPSGGRISLSVHAAGGELTLSVRDGGPGFSAEALNRAGSAFYTSETSRPQNGHMGLGLYFVRCVAQAHGGDMRLSNGPAGALAEIWMPMDGDGRED